MCQHLLLQVSFNSASLFFTKVASGNVGVMRSRDLKTLSLGFSVFQLPLPKYGKWCHWVRKIVQIGRVVASRSSCFSGPEDWQHEHSRQLFLLLCIRWVLPLQRCDRHLDECVCCFSIFSQCAVMS